MNLSVKRPPLPGPLLPRRRGRRPPSGGRVSYLALPKPNCLLMPDTFDMYYPTLQEFKELASQGNLVPVARRLLADLETPLSAYRKIRGPAESFLFESVEGGEHLGRYSFVGCSPRAVIRQLGNRVEVLENGKVLESFAVRSAGGASGERPPPP